ncbi:MAG: flagellar assembly protein FliX [Acetobacteraceae bacterium]
MSDIKPVGARPAPGTLAGRQAVPAAAEFRLPGAAGNGPAAPVVLPGAPADLGGVLALEDADERLRRNRRARRRSEDLLAALARLQRTLLAGAEPGAATEALRALLAELPQADAPELAATLRAIALRAHIALALHG